MVDEYNNEIYQSPKYTVNYGRHKVSWKIGTGRTIAAYVAAKKEFVKVDDVLADERFPEGVGWKGPTIKAVMCVPVITPDADCFAVIELYKETEEPFTQKDLETVIAVTGWMGASVHQNQRRLALQRQQKLNEYLLELTTCYFTHNVEIEKMISEIVQFAKTTLTAERGSFFVVCRDEGDNLVADLFDEGLDQTGGSLHKKKMKIRFNKERDVAGVVARTGQTVNIRDAYADARYNVDSDTKTGNITRSVLCTPIMSKDTVLGILQVINKKSNKYFDREDESLFKTFAVYCSLALHYSKVNASKLEAEKKCNVYRDLLSFHMRPTIAEVRPFLTHPYLSEPPNGFDEFSWYVYPDHMAQMSQLMYYMIVSICGDRFPDMNVMANFLIMTRKSYRDNAYHNYEHAFNVTHCMYAILLRNSEIFTDLEAMGLIFAAICHDADHRGFTNSYMQLSNDPLYQLYGEATMEHHHVFIAMIILDISGIFDQLPKEHYVYLKQEIAENILSTDLLSHFRARARLLNILKSGTFEFENQSHKVLLKSTMMTCCDLSGNSKPYKSAKRVCENLMKEFFNQGDNEKEMGLSPLSLMDRDKQHMIPQDQIQFINVICQPANELLAAIFPNCEALYTLAKDLQESWREVIQLRNHRVWKPDDSVPTRKKVALKGDDTL